MSPEDKRATLKALREAIGQIEVGKTARKGFTKAQRQRVWDRQDGLCAACNGPLGLSWPIDHRIPLAHGGAHEPDNWQGLCVPCHTDKTRSDVGNIAKVNRIRKREAEGKKTSRIKSRGFAPGKRKLQSRGFPKRR